MRPRVHWDDHEISKIVARIVELRISDPTSPFLQIVNKAQEEILPPDRRRTFRALKQISFLPSIRHELSLYARYDDVLTQEDFSGITLTEMSATPPPASDLSSIYSLPDLAKALSEKFLFEIKSLQSTPQKVPLPQPVVKPITPVTPVTHEKKKMRILIMGGSVKEKCYQHSIKERVDASQVDLIFHTPRSDGSVSRIPISADYIICTARNRHAAVSVAKDKYGRDRLIFLGKGGVESIAAEIRKLYATQQ